MTRRSAVSIVALCFAAVMTAYGEDFRRLAYQTALPVKGTITVDGKLDEQAWTTADWNDRYYEFLKPNPKRVSTKTHCTILYASDALYIGVRNFEPQITKMRRSVTRNHHGGTWHDDCGEFYIDPAAKGIGFYKYVVNSRGCFDDSWQMDRANHFEQWNSEGVSSAAHVDESNKVWTIELRIPWNDLGLASPPKSGDVWMFLHNRFRYVSRGWGDFCSSAPEAAYHAPDKFGYVFFSDGSLPDMQEIVRRIDERLDIAWFLEIGERLAFHDEDGTHFSTSEKFWAKVKARERELADWRKLARKIAKAKRPMPKVPLERKRTQQPPDEYDGYNGYYIHHLQGTFETPHFDWAPDIAEPLYVVWANPYWGARMRHAAELFQRFGFNGECMTTFWNSGLGGHGPYDDPVKGGTPNEKEAQFTNILIDNPDVMFFWHFPIVKIRADLYYEILRRVHDEGMGLVLGHAPLPGDFGRMRRDEATERLILSGADYNAKALRVYRFGKGRVITLGYELRDRDWDLGWAADFEFRNAYLARITLAAAGKLRPWRMQGDVVEERIRDDRNRIYRPGDDLPAGTYYRDWFVRAAPAWWKAGFSRGEIVDFGCEKFTRSGRTFTLEAPYEAPESRPFEANVVFDVPVDLTTEVVVELRDLPDSHLRDVKRITLAPGEKSASVRFEGYKLTNLAGYLNARAIGYGGKVLSRAWRHIYFPNWDWPVYTQINWESLNNAGVAGLIGRRMVEDWGWDCNLGEQGPFSAHWNARGLASASLLRIGAYPDGSVKDALSCAVTGWDGRRWNEIIKEIGKDENPFRPEVRAVCDREYGRRFSKTKSHGMNAYNLGDECHYSTASGYGPSDKKYFPEFLERKYGSIENYNRIAGTKWKNFSEVPHLKLKEARDKDDTQSWFDHIQYVEAIYAEAMKIHREAICRIDPRARVGAEGSDPGDLELTVKNLKFWGPYKSKVQNELLRVISAEDVLRGVWWGGYVNEPRDGEIRLQWGFMLTGVSNCNLWYTAEPGSTMGIGNGAYEIAPYFEKQLPKLHALRWGSAQQLVVTPLVHQKLAIWYSHASNRAAELDETAVQPGDTQNAFIDFCYRHGIGFDIVSKTRLEALKNHKLVILAGAHSLTEAEIDAIKNFVKNGGTVLADAEPCRFSEWMTRRADKPLNGYVKLMESPLGTLRRKMKDDVAFDGKVMAMLAPYGIKPLIELKGAEAWPLTKFRIRRGSGFLLAGALFPEGSEDGRFTLKVPGGVKRHIYRVDGGYVGYADEIELDGRDYPWAQFSFFEERQNAPEIRLEKNVFAPGESIVLPSASMRPNGVYLVTVKGARVEKRVHCVKDGSKPYTFNFALDDECTSWTIEVKDMATGLISEKTVMLKKASAAKNR